MINVEKVRRHFQGREEVMKQMFGMFVEDAPPRMAALKTTLGACEYESAARAAHDIANMAAAIRAEDAVACASALQQALTDGDGSRAAGGYDRLVYKMNEVMACIKRWETTSREEDIP